ncbi:MAG: DUF4124 domain-containing protein [Nitrospirales bacterium]|nr:DUF4124 domain-containing protein [Nitrospirales bacterium]
MKWSPVLSSVLALALASLLLLLADGPALGDTYEWVDGNGNVGYADSLASVPEPYRKSAKRIRERKDTGALQSAPAIPDSRGDTAPLPSLEETYAPWKERVRIARAELDKLKAERQKAQAAYDDPLHPTWIPTLRLFPIDPEKQADSSSKIKELDQRIQDKEYELNTTIPDQARQAGVPPGVLSQ